MAELLTAHSLIALLAITALEIVLGIDNVVFIAILTGKLPEEKRPMARRVGLGLAALGRIALLFAITWVMMLEETVLFTAFGVAISMKDVILIVGGAFLLGKGTWEIHHSIEGAAAGHEEQAPVAATFGAVITQILLLDLVFSIDSVLTAIGMVEPKRYSEFWMPLSIMITAILIAIAVMLIFAGPLSRFIERHPTIKMLALSFLLLIGIVLIAEGLHQHIPRGYIYFGMGFSLFVELLNVRLLVKLKKARAKKAAKQTE